MSTSGFWTGIWWVTEECFAGNSALWVHCVKYSQNGAGTLGLIFWYLSRKACAWEGPSGKFRQAAMVSTPHNTQEALVLAFNLAIASLPLLMDPDSGAGNNTLVE